MKGKIINFDIPSNQGGIYSNEGKISTSNNERNLSTPKKDLNELKVSRAKTDNIYIILIKNIGIFNIMKKLITILVLGTIELFIISKFFNNSQNNLSSFASPISTNAVNEENNDAKKIRSLLEDQVRGLNTKNIALAMSPITDENPESYQKIKKLIQYIFDKYDLKYKINKIEILKISDNQAIVRITQTTQKIRGPKFRDNILVSKNTLIKSKGLWKVKSTEIENIKYLN